MDIEEFAKEICNLSDKLANEKFRIHTAIYEFQQDIMRSVEIYRYEKVAEEEKRLKQELFLKSRKE